MTKRLESLPELLALAGIGLVLVLVPLLPGRAHIGPFSIDILIVSVPVALLLCVPLFRKAGASGLPRVGIDAPALAFLAIALIGIPFAGGGASSFGTLLRYAGYIALVPAVALLARDTGNRRTLLWLLVAAGAGTVIVGVLQYLNPATLQLIGMQGLDGSVAGRIYSTYANPNFYSEYLVLLVGATLSLAFLERGFLRGLAIALLACEGFVLLATYTRGSWVALAVGLLVAAMMIDFRYIWGLAAAALVAAVAVPGVGRRIVSIFSLSGTASFRLRLWRLAGTIIGQHLVFGVGIGHFIDAFKVVSIQHPELATTFLIYGAHNSYLTLMAETGVIGGLAFVWLIAAMCKMGVFYGARMDGDITAKLQNAALTVGIVAFAFNALTSNSFQHPQAAVFFWVVAGLQAGVGGRFWNQPLEQKQLLSVPGGAARGLVSSSMAVRAVVSVGRSLQAVWDSSDAHQWLISKPRGGEVIRRSRLVTLVFGTGKTTGGAGSA
jgi:putative inorganic carbon (hco3(-)) transporter